MSQKSSDSLIFNLIYDEFVRVGEVRMLILVSF